MGWLVAVHTGAGRYSTCDDAAFLALMQRALQSGADLLAQLEHTPASDTGASQCSHAALVASRMLRVFERDERTNAGLGANLTELGHVECEASVTCGKTRLVSACANVRGVAEPSSLAYALMDQAARVAAQDDANDATTRAFAFNREPPLVLVGDHARTLATQFGIETASSECDLETYQVTPRASASWRKWHARFQAAAEPSDATSTDSATLLTSESSTARNDADESEQLLDTVGAICIDHDGNLAAALSSGGVAYKVPGRVGLAGCPRMGCDAANAQPRCQTWTRKRKRSRRSTKTEAACARSGFAVACTGRGEHFVRSGFVAHLTRALRKARPVSLERAFRCVHASVRWRLRLRGPTTLTEFAFSLARSFVDGNAQESVRRRTRRERRRADRRRRPRTLHRATSRRR